ncbi:MAG: ABC transporter substrate-binding protein [Dehalococcoidia bacterium]
MSPQTKLTNTSYIDDVSRRGLLIGALTAAIFVACGDDGEKDEASAPAATTRTVDTPLGPVDVPVRPERVVVFDRRGTLAYLLDLGITPVGAMSAPTIYGSKFHPLLPGVENVEAFDWQAPDLEKVAAMQPDLIVGYRNDVEKVYPQLSAIAPTVALALELNNPQKELTELGTVFGLEDKATKLTQEFEAEVAAAKAKVGTPGTVSIILPLLEGVRVYRGDDMAGQIIRALGKTITPDISKLGAEPSVDILLISFEQVSAIDGETLVVLANLSSEYSSIKENLYNMPVFKTLPSVRAGRVVEIESQANFGTAGLRGQRQILDALVKAFA